MGKKTETAKKVARAIVKAMLDREELSLQERRAFWNNVVFYNYVQVAMTGPRIAPSKRDFESSEPAFFEVLEGIKEPDDDHNCFVIASSGTGG